MFYEGLHKTFWAPQRSVKKKLSYFFPSSGIGAGVVMLKAEFGDDLE